MRGEVIGYGKMGDPVVRPYDGGRLVILKKYDTLPEMGEEIAFELSIFNRSRNDRSGVRFGYPVKPESS